MSVWYRQVADGEVMDEQVIDPEAHPDLSTDLELLHRKAAGAADKGWEVEWTSETSFTATKDRWSGTLVTREFWVAD